MLVLASAGTSTGKAPGEVPLKRLQPNLLHGELKADALLLVVELVDAAGRDPLNRTFQPELFKRVPLVHQDKDEGHARVK